MTKTRQAIALAEMKKWKDISKVGCHKGRPILRGSYRKVEKPIPDYGKDTNSFREFLQSFYKRRTAHEEDEFSGYLSYLSQLLGVHAKVTACHAHSVFFASVDDMVRAFLIYNNKWELTLDE